MRNSLPSLLLLLLATIARAAPLGDPELHRRMLNAGEIVVQMAHHNGGQPAPHALPVQMTPPVIQAPPMRDVPIVNGLVGPGLPVTRLPGRRIASGYRVRPLNEQNPNYEPPMGVSRERACEHAVAATCILGLVVGCCLATTHSIRMLQREP